MPEQLKPCPFCGGTDIDMDECKVLMEGVSPYWSAFCNGCETNGPATWIESEAITAWNTRKGEEG